MIGLSLTVASLAQVQSDSPASQSAALAASSTASSPLASIVCPNYSRVLQAAGYPAEARALGLASGDALIEFTLDGDQTINVSAVRSSDPVFARAAVAIVEQFRCKGQTHPIRVFVPFKFRLQ